MTNFTTMFGDLRIPRSLSDAGDIARHLEAYTAENYFSVMISIFTIYVFLQTFCIPGTTFVNVVCGCVFGIFVALPMCILAGSTGALSCYLLVHFFGRQKARRCLGVRLDSFASSVRNNKADLFWFLLFLRVSPVLPNWLINIASPLVDVPASVFFFATAIGITPATYIAVSVGRALHLSAASSVPSDLAGVHTPASNVPIFGRTSYVAMMAGGLLCLLPILVRHLYADRFQIQSPRESLNLSSSGSTKIVLPVSSALQHPHASSHTAPHTSSAGHDAPVGRIGASPPGSMHNIHRLESLASIVCRSSVAGNAAV